jgi:glycosyltransferase involved in cell wall biosynthesis/peptidoglycan/xylan/chitin deacetylase (PgdA/CDA1 family)
MMKAKITMPSMLLFPYYLMRPLIPRRFQIYLRRMRCRHILASRNLAWPIDPTTSRKPDGWPGWPGGKDFALVLSHDVEGLKGLERVRDIMLAEKSLEFRSCFNFVARDYPVPQELLNQLKREGYEIGVHGLHHNGLMYSTRSTFRRHALGIQQCMKEWHAVGFRSPAMHRNLEWLHDLGMRYDSSTFDTDPFEPQPDGVGSIFPLWIINRAASKGYIELPYTLPQDFTIHVILQEKDIGIWKRKLEWIAAQGGMALLVTHPDYLCPEGSTPGREEYPRSYYLDLLKHIRDRYEGRYWHALPAEVADYFASIYPLELELERIKSSIKRRPLRVCMPTYSFYESDNRVRRYAETLAREGNHVEVFSLKRPGQKNVERLHGVQVNRIQQRTRNETGPLSYLFKTSLFLLRSMARISLRELRRHYDLVHVHNIPDTQVFAAALPKLRGAKVILDIHDIVPELFCDKFGKGADSRLFKWICAKERFSAHFAHHVIVSNDLWREKLVRRSVLADRCTVLLNYPDTSIFHRDTSEARNGSGKLVVYPGTLNYHQGLDIAICAFAEAAKCIPEAEFHIYGEGPARKALIRQIAQLNLSQRVFVKDPLPIDMIAPVMAEATCGVVPKRAEGFGNEAFSTKIMEFMALGVPMLVSKTAVDSYYFDDSLVLFFESGNASDLAEKMILMLQDDGFRSSLAARAREFIRANTWDVKKSVYLDLIDRLLKADL